MLKHNLFLFLRNIKKNKGTFLINTLGLGIGIASFLVLALYVYNDLTYDRFHKSLSNIYRIREGESIQTKGLLLPKMMEDIPEVVNGTRIFDWEGARIAYGDNAFFENVHYVDEGFFELFSFPFVEGPVNNPIEDKYGVVISTELAEKYFGDAPALGKRLQANFDGIFLTVNGVVEIPENSSIQFDILGSYETGEEVLPWTKDVHDWYNTFSNTYVQLQAGTGPTDIQDQLQRIVKEHFLPVGKSTVQLNLLPFSEYHATVESNRTLIVILALVALGIIGIAIVNFINLTLTNAMSRTKEIGIKKVHGATKSHLVRQIMTESFVVGLFALLFGVVLMATVLLPTFNSLFDAQLDLESFKNMFFISLLFGIWLIVGLMSSLVPSFFWAQGKLVDGLRGKVSSGNKSSLSKHSSIVVQFVIAIVLISGTLLIRKQIRFMVDKDPKFDTENVIITELDSWQFQDLETASQKFQRISEELEADPYVASVSFSTTVPGAYQHNYNVFYPEGGSEQDVIHMRKAYVGANYFKTMGIDLINGTGFEKDAMPYENALVLNKTAMSKLGLGEVHGQVLHESSPTGSPYKIIGTVDDYSYQGAQHQTQPLAHIYLERENYADWPYLIVKSKEQAGLRVLESLKTAWDNAFPGTPVNHFFADSKLNAYYKEYERVNTLITWFSLLAIMLSCMGLFALSAYAIARRTKEIGIRKVNGATIGQILSLLNKDFLKWVVLAFVIAVPISWYTMDKWLEGFAYKTTMSWWIFVLAGITALIIALLTVSWQSFKAAIANPVESLRTE